MSGSSEVQEQSCILKGHDFVTGAFEQIRFEGILGSIMISLYVLHEWTNCNAANRHLELPGYGTKGCSRY